MIYASITGKLEIRKRREEGMKIENLNENKEFKKEKKSSGTQWSVGNSSHI